VTISTYRGRFSWDYAPEPNSEPDPGEVVWAWVPYQEDPNRGKDRPLLVIGRPKQGEGYVALLLSSRDRRGEQGWVLLGVGDWDSEGRESWVKVDRLLLISGGEIRREGGVLSRERFLEVAKKAARERAGENLD
jgi:hypothetical protein